MDSSYNKPYPIEPHNPILQVDYQWRRFKALVTENDGTSNPSTPKYIIDYNTFKSPHLVFHPADEPSRVVGSGTLHPVSIHADYDLQGRKGTLKALKRWVTSYTHLSYNYSNSSDGSPAAMTWTSSSNFKTWDFICLDEENNPVAKFSANAWAIKKMANIEFLGPKANDPAAREEILITGLTLYSCMVLRVSSIFSFFGAIFARTGPLDKEAEDEGYRRSSDEKAFLGQREISFPKDEKV
ncbi:hypothetical protein ACJ41O_012941 [Fusarium nematophilum]